VHLGKFPMVQRTLFCRHHNFKRCYWWACQKKRDHREDQDNIKMDLREIKCDGMDWIDVAQNRD
jgi:hypothetical protein